MSDPTWIELSLLLGLGAWVSGLVNLWMNLRSVHTLTTADSAPPGDCAPRLSILVPARDEEPSIGAAVESFCQQDYPDFEVIVVNDRSSDKTGEILAELGGRFDNLTVLEGAEPPNGWLGKAYALETAQRFASGEWLLLIDADVVLEPGAARAAIGRAVSEEIDLISGIVDYRRYGFWEELLISYFRNLQLTITRLARFLPDRVRSRIAVGSFILIRREAYDAIGLHESIRSELPNDVAIAKAIARAGRTWEFLFLDRLVHWRMYQGFGGIWNGFVKNWFPMTGGTVAGFVLHLLFVASQLAPWIAGVVLIGVEPLEESDPRTIALAITTFGVFLLIAMTIRTRFPSSAWSIPLYPLAVSVFFLISLRSAWRHVVVRRIEWRGREYGGSKK